MTEFRLAPGIGRRRRIVPAFAGLCGVVLLAAAVASGAIVGDGHRPADAASFIAETSFASNTTPLAVAPLVTPAVSSTPAASQTTVAVPTSTPFVMPIVPVASFWSAPGSVALASLSGMWSGQTASVVENPSVARTPFTTLFVPNSVSAGLARYFGTAPASTVHVVSLDEVKAAVRNPSALGLIGADDVTPDVRALALDGDSLFGSERMSEGRSWRLTVASATPSLITTNGVWALAAGGDVNLDRMVYVRAVAQGRGADFPWSAGTARLVHYECCGWDGAALGVARSTGNSETLRSRFLDADLALVNFEGSAPNDYSYRSNSLTFTFDPALLGGLRDAGIDMVSLANNHIRNGGDQGVLDTCSNLDKAGIGHAGAGANPTAARKPGWLTADHLSVAVLAYSAVGVGNWATGSHPGAAPLRTDQVAADIRAVRAAGADIVIVVPHWGQEYSYYVSSTQKTDAAAFVAAGADLVLGSHSHWVGAIQSLPGSNGAAFVDYSMGDLLFDLNHDLQSQEGEVVTLSFVGKRLAQVQIDPTIMIDGAQVGLLDPSGDGRSVLDAIRRASHGLLDW